jgi:MFS family permease
MADIRPDYDCGRRRLHPPDQPLDRRAVHQIRSGVERDPAGLVLSAFVTTYALGQIPGGLVGERFGPRRVVTWLLAGWGVVTLLTGLLPSHTVLPMWLLVGFLLVLRSAMGLLQAPLFPVMSGGTVVRDVRP